MRWKKKDENDIYKLNTVEYSEDDYNPVKGNTVKYPSYKYNTISIKK